MAVIRYYNCTTQADVDAELYLSVTNKERDQSLYCNLNVEPHCSGTGNLIKFIGNFIKMNELIIFGAFLIGMLTLAEGSVIGKHSQQGKVTDFIEPCSSILSALHYF